MALGGRETFMKIAHLLFAELGHPVDPDVLADIDLPSPASLRALASQRDERLAEMRKRDLADGAKG